MNPFQYLQDNIFYTDAKKKEINAAAARNASGKRNSSVPSMMTKGEVYGDPTPTIQPGNRPRGSMFMDPVGPSRSMPGAGSFMDPVAPANADVTKLQGKPGRQIYPVEQTTTNAAGVVQTGKNLGGGGTPIDMSRSFDDLLRGVGQQPFSSNQLPTTMANPYTATYKQTAGFGDEVPDIGGYNGATYDSEGGRTAVSSRDLSQFENFTGNEARIAGGSERISQQATGITSGRLSDALNSVREEEANREMTPERRQQMASMAFLNAGDSMSGLKARDAVNDVVYAGGQHYGRGALTEDGKLGDKYKIDRADARDIASGKQTASGLRDVYINALKESRAASTPVEKQEPATIEKPGVKESFARTEPITKGIDTTIPDTTAFNTNNDDAIPGFGNTGGYKPMSKKPGVDYSSIFSY